MPALAVLPAAIITGLVSEAAKYLYILVLPWLNFQEVYGPFSVSVTLIFWSLLERHAAARRCVSFRRRAQRRIEARRATAASR